MSVRKIFLDYKTICIYILVFTLFLIIPLLGNHAIMVYSENVQSKNTVIIDAGHGGIDSGAVSCSGIYESHLNLQIATRFRDLAHLLGLTTIMIRDTDTSLHTEGNTIAAQKISDIRERVRIVNTTPNALLVSIHQNSFLDNRYSGTQVFYNNQQGSKDLAEKFQIAFKQTLDSSNHRQPKRITGVYLMEHINCTGILIECGFLSNPQEEALLRDEEYQKALCCVIATSLHQYLNT